MPTSKVTMILDGLIVLAAKLDEVDGEVGVLKFHPFHDFKIHVTKFFTNGTTDEFDVKQIQKELKLVTDPATKITARDTTDVDRMVHPSDHFQSIKWFVDLEDGKKFYKRLQATRTEFEPIIKFKGGELYTAEPVNDSILEVFRGLTVDPEPIGRVALKLGIDFSNLNSVSFRNDPRPVIFDTNIDGAGTNYTVLVSNNRKPHGGLSNDADLYYTGLGGNLHPEELITFRSVSNRIRQLEESIAEIHSQGERHAEFEKKQQETLDKLHAIGDQRAGPEAACFPAYLSQSKLS